MTDTTLAAPGGSIKHPGGNVVSLAPAPPDGQHPDLARTAAEHLERLGLRLRRNTLADRIELAYSQAADTLPDHHPRWEDYAWREIDKPDYAGIWMAAKRRGIKIPKHDWPDIILGLAHDHSRKINPFIEHIEGGQWDGIPKLPELLTKTLGAAPGPLAEWGGISPLMSAIHLAYNPEAEAPHEHLVLRSDKGETGKSLIIRQLLPNPEWFTTLTVSDNLQKIAENIEGTILFEWAEQATSGRPSQQYTKAFSTQGIIKLRKAWAIKTSRIRIPIMIITTNDPLTPDNSGQRRWLVVEVTGRMTGDDIVAYMKEYRDQLWYEALARYKWAADSDDKTDWSGWRMDGRLPKHLKPLAAQAAQDNTAIDIVDEIAAELTDKYRGKEAVSIMVLLDEIDNPKISARKLGPALTRYGWQRQLTGSSRVALWHPPAH